MITFRPIGIFISVPDPDPTVNIPAYTIRIRMVNGGNPPSSQAGATISQPFPSQFPNIYDYTLNSNDWNHILASVSDSFEIVGINSTGVENMNRMFDLSGGLQGSIPLFDTSSAYDVENMFYECHYVTGGMSALYNQMANQSNPPYSHSGCFSGCGDMTVTGQAELAQIPGDWGGTQQTGAAYNYRIMFASNNSTLKLNTICMDRSQEGTGNCYLDSDCNYYLSELSSWDSGTADTELMGAFDGNYYIYDIYVKDVTVNSGSYGTIIAGQSDYEWSIVYVFDSYGNMIGSGTTTPSYSGEWVDFSNGS